MEDLLQNARECYNFTFSTVTARTTSDNPTVDWDDPSFRGTYVSCQTPGCPFQLKLLRHEVQGAAVTTEDVVYMWHATKVHYADVDGEKGPVMRYGVSRHVGPHKAIEVDCDRADQGDLDSADDEDSEDENAIQTSRTRLPATCKRILEGLLSEKRYNVLVAVQVALHKPVCRKATGVTYFVLCI